MKDLTLRPLATGRTPEAPPAPPAASPPPGPAAPVSPGLGHDAVSGTGAGPAAGFDAAHPSTSFAGRQPAPPAPGTPEATLLQDMAATSGVPPQWQEAFQQLSPADQRAMAQMYQQLGPQGKTSFLHYPPEDRVAMSQMFSRLNPAQQTAYGQLTPGQQRSMAQMYAGMSGPAKAAFLAQPATDQRAMAVAFRGLDGPAQAAFLRLEPAQQAQFGRVWLEAGRVEFGHAQQSGDTAQTIFSSSRESTAVTTRIQLSTLLTGGRLTQAGPGGHTALEALDRLRTTPLTPPTGTTPETIYRQDVFNTLVTELNNPGGIRQGNYSTCGATCAQRMFARTNPGDYAHFVVGLASTAGRGTLPDGTGVRRVDDSLVAQTPDHARDSRNQLERLVQASLMNQASPVHYSNARDSNTVLGIPIASGMNGSGIASLYSAMRRRPVEVLPSDSVITTLDGGWQTGVSKAHVVDGLTTQLQRHPNETVPVEIHWNGTGGGNGDLHWVDVSRVTNDRVYYSNPHGNSFRIPNGQTLASLPVDPANGLHYVDSPATADNPPHRIYEDGSESFDRSWFTHTVEEAVVDPDVRDRVRASEPPPSYPSF